MSLSTDQVEAALRPHRKALVEKAEAVVFEAQPRDLDDKRWNKTQLPLLVGVATEAACPEEVRNFLRYQSARKTWPKQVANRAIEGIGTVLEALDQEHAGLPEPDRDALKTAAWRLYATYMTRAYTYCKATSDGR